jgi:hypothetical protein
VLSESQPASQPSVNRANLPDKETMFEDILILRQTRNVNEEQIRLLKVTLARLKRHCEKLEDQIYKNQFDSQPEWVKHKEPSQGMQVNDLEGALAEIIRLKRENNMLIEQRQFFKVNSDKYQKRAIFMRKKYTELKSVMKEKNPKKPKDPSEYRLMYTQAKSALKNK